MYRALPLQTACSWRSWTVTVTALRLGRSYNSLSAPHRLVCWDVALRAALVLANDNSSEKIRLRTNFLTLRGLVSAVIVCEPGVADNEESGYGGPAGMISIPLILGASVVPTVNEMPIVPVLVAVVVNSCTIALLAAPAAAMISKFVSTRAIDGHAELALPGCRPEDLGEVQTNGVTGSGRQIGEGI